MRIALPIIAIFLLSFTVFVSCKKDVPVSFCEGSDNEGKGVNCGATFSTGDLTLVVLSDDRFETENLHIEIFQKTSYKNEKLSSIEQKVVADKNTTTVPISFYIEGDYLVDVYGKDNKKIGSGAIKVIDTY